MVIPIEPTGGSARANAHPLLYVVLGLVVLNLVATLALYQRISVSGQSSIAEPRLPQYLTRATLSGLAEAIRDDFNSKRWDALYDQFDPVAQLQFSRDQLVEQFERLGPLIGHIDRWAYSHHKFIGKQDAGNVFELHYVLQVSGGTFATGTMIVTFVDRDDHPGIYSIFINGRG